MKNPTHIRHRRTTPLRKKHRLVLLLLIPALFLSVQTSFSGPKRQKDPALTGVTVTTSDTDLLLFSTLENGFTDGMVQGLQSGLPIHYTFYVELAATPKEQDRETQRTMTTDHIVTYDTLKDNYQVEIEESGKRLFSYTSLKEAERAVNEINGLRVIPLTDLKKGVSYTVRIKAELDKKELPLGLQNVVPFVSLWDIKTRWYSVTFKL